MKSKQKFYGKRAEDFEKNIFTLEQGMNTVFFQQLLWTGKVRKRRCNNRESGKCLMQKSKANLDD